MEQARRKASVGRLPLHGLKFGDVVLRYPAVLAVLVDAPEPAAIRIGDAERFAHTGGKFGGGVVAKGYGRLAASLEKDGGRPTAFAARIGTPDPAPGGIVIPVGDLFADADLFPCLERDGVGKLGGVLADDLAAAFGCAGRGCAGHAASSFFRLRTLLFFYDRAVFLTCLVRSCGLVAKRRRYDDDERAHCAERDGARGDGGSGRREGWRAGWRRAARQQRSRQGRARTAGGGAAQRDIEERLFLYAGGGGVAGAAAGGRAGVCRPSWAAGPARAERARSGGVLSERACGDAPGGWRPAPPGGSGGDAAPVGVGRVAVVDAARGAGARDAGAGGHFYRCAGECGGAAQRRERADGQRGDALCGDE